MDFVFEETKKIQAGKLRQPADGARSY